MNYIDKVSEFLHRANYLTPYEKSVILARLQLKQFNSVIEMEKWLMDEICDLIESDCPQQEILEVRKRNA